MEEHATRALPLFALWILGLPADIYFSLSAIIYYCHIRIGYFQSLRMPPMAERKPSKPKKLKTARWQRIAMMDKEILDVEGAATLLGVSTTTIYNLARKGEIPATRVGREWRFARTNLIQWVANGAAADQLSVALSCGRVAKKK